MHKAVRLGIDVGKSRIGVARTDVDATMAVPVETVKRDEYSISRIKELADEYAVGVIYVGLPLSLSGGATASTRDAIEFAEQIQAAVEAPVRLVDERLSTVSAASALHSAGHNVKSAKGIIDQAAAIVILEHALSSEKSTSDWAGRAIDE